MQIHRFVALTLNSTDVRTQVCLYRCYFILQVALNMARPIRFQSKNVLFHKMEVTWLVQTAEALREEADDSKNSAMSTPFSEDTSEVDIESQDSRLLIGTTYQRRRQRLLSPLSLRPIICIHFHPAAQFATTP